MFILYNGGEMYTYTYTDTHTRHCFLLKNKTLGSLLLLVIPKAVGLPKRMFPLAHHACGHNILHLVNAAGSHGGAYFATGLQAAIFHSSHPYPQSQQQQKPLELKIVSLPHYIEMIRLISVSILKLPSLLLCLFLFKGP